MTSIGLKSHIWRNNSRSVILLAAYPFIILAMVGLITFLIAFATISPNLQVCLQLGSPECIEYTKTEDGQIDRAPTAVTISKTVMTNLWPLILSGVAIWFMIAYFFQTRLVRALSHAHAVTREEEPELYNMLENLCISRGMAMPQLEIIETHARNAFASGTDERTYTITVTRGLLQSLQKDEVEAVLGHELTHIINGDVRLLIVSIIFTGMIGFLAQMAWSSMRLRLYTRGRRSDGRILIVMLIIVAVLWLGYLATMFTRFALSRRREFMADAGAIELTKNPEAMMRALLRLSGKDRIPEATSDIALMCIENSQKFLGLFATHPPLQERIEVISSVTYTPIPDIKPGRRSENKDRFKQPEERTNPWLTAQRPGRNNSEKGSPFYRFSRNDKKSK